MKRYSSELKLKIRNLRLQGKTYGEINRELGENLAKSTLADLCRGVELPEQYSRRINNLNLQNVNKARIIALEVNRIKREKFFLQINEANMPLSLLVKDKNIAKIALSMLCLGEASKYSSKNRGFSLGNSDPRIIVLFVHLLKFCFNFELKKIRCRVQCRADQDTEELNKYWQAVTGIPRELFSKPLIDPRTVGKPTLKLNYKGVLRVDYFDTKVQHELESLASLIYNQVRLFGPVVN